MRCFHCSRELKGTTHRQRDYTIDYYLLHTGKAEWEFFRNPKDDDQILRYLKLTHPTDILTCVQCYSQPAIKKLLDDDFTGVKPIIDPDREDNRTQKSRAEGDG